MKFTDHIIPSMFSTATFSPPKWLDHGRTSKWHDDKKNNGLCINPYHFYQSGKYPFLLLVLLAIFSILVQKSGNLGSQSTPVVYKRSCVILNTCVMLVQRATPYPKMSWGFSARTLNKTESLPDLFSLAYSVTSHFFSDSNKGSTPDNYLKSYYMDLYNHLARTDGWSCHQQTNRL